MARPIGTRPAVLAELDTIHAMQREVRMSDSPTDVERACWEIQDSAERILVFLSGIREERLTHIELVDGHG